MPIRANSGLGYVLARLVYASCWREDSGTVWLLYIVACFRYKRTVFSSTQGNPINQNGGLKYEMNDSVSVLTLRQRSKKGPISSTLSLINEHCVILCRKSEQTQRKKKGGCIHIGWWNTSFSEPSPERVITERVESRNANCLQNDGDGYPKRRMEFSQRRFHLTNDRRTQHDKS